MIERENAENLDFQLKQLQMEGKCVGSIKKHLEEQIWDEVEKKLSPIRPRWKIIDSDTGIIFAKKEMKDGSIKHMDILEGEDEERGTKYKSIIIYETGGADRPVMVRTNARKKR